MMVRTFLLLFSLLAAAVPMTGRAAEIRYVAAESAITVEGTIVAGDDAKVEAFLDQRPHNLIIRSDGGRQVPSIGIARAVRAHEMTVIVDGFCASACAQIIFPAAAERRIRPGSFIAFHGGNLSVLQAVREAIVQQTAALQAPGDPASAAERDAHRAAILQALKRSENQLDVIEGDQASFDADMKLDPAVIDFYLRLTALRDIRIELHPGEASPVRVAVGRRGICDWWVPDADGLGKLGLRLRNTYEVPSPAMVASMAHTTPERLYFGPPLAADDPRLASLCPTP